MAALAAVVLGLTVLAASCSLTRKSDWQPRRDPGPCDDLPETKLRSDADIEAFDTSHAEALVIEDGVTTLLGLQNLSSATCLTIKGNPELVSLEGLEGMTSIEGKLDIEDNEKLVSLSGLQNVRTIGGKVVIKDSPSLVTLSGLRNVRAMGQLIVEKNVGLVSMAGLESLERVEEEVEITNNENLGSLVGLERLSSVGSLLVLECPELSDLSGLESLQTTKSLQIAQNHGLRSLSGLDNLTSVWGEHFTEGDLEILENDNLLSITGLEGVKRVVDLKIIDNKRLASIKGLIGLEWATSIHIENNGELLSLAGLDNLAAIEDQLIIERNDLLSNLSGLERVPSARMVVIERNNELTSFAGLRSLKVVQKELVLSHSLHATGLEGLENLTTVGSLFIRDLYKITSLNALKSLSIAFQGISVARCWYLRSLEGMTSLQHTSLLAVGENDALDVLGGVIPAGSSADMITFGEESWPRCTTPHELDVLARTVRFVQRSALPDASWERWRQNSCGWEVFTCILGKACELDLHGNNGSVQSVFISHQDGGCGACPTALPLQFNVTWDGKVDFGFALAGERAGSRAICRCSGEVGPVAQLLLRGPLPEDKPAVCMRGSDCTLTLNGEALMAKDRVVLTSSCEAGGGLGHDATWAAENTYVLDEEKWYAAPPTRYEVCWRAPCAAQGCQGTQESKYLKAGSVELHGVYSKSHTPRTFGQNLSIPNIGFGVMDGDLMRLSHTCGGKADDDSTGATLEAASTNMVFDFGMLAPELLRPGKYHLCWCRVRDGVDCKSEQQFAAESGSVEITCPAGQELTGSRDCRSCRAGTHQPGSGFDPCLPCPAGEFSAEGALACEACEDGTSAPLAGSSACAGCRPWESADADHLGCSTDPVKVVLSLSFLLCIAVLCVKLVQVTRVHHPVVDVSQQEDRTVVTILNSHGISQCGAGSFGVTFKDTGHPALDSPKVPFRAKVKDAARLELIGPETNQAHSLKQRMDTSQGSLVVAFPSDLFHTGWPVPMVFFLPLLATAAVALGVVILASDMANVVYLGAPIAALVCTAASAAIRRRPREAPLGRRLADFAVEPLHTPKASLRGPERAISIGKLHEVLEYFRDFIQDRTAYYLTACILNPLTKRKRLSYAEWTGASEVEWFVSHYWGTAFQHLCDALQKHAESVCEGTTREWTSIKYWVCFCSNNQHVLELEMGSGWQDSSFFLTLQSGLCHGTCMVLDEEALPLTRAWCIFELLQTLLLERSDAGFQGLLLCTSTGVLNNGGGSVEVAVALAKMVVEMDLGCAKASKQEDEEMIREYVRGQLGEFDKLNNFIRCKVRLMLVSAKNRASERFQTVLARLVTYIEVFTM